MNFQIVCNFFYKEKSANWTQQRGVSIWRSMDMTKPSRLFCLDVIYDRMRHWVRICSLAILSSRGLPACPPPEIHIVFPVSYLLYFLTIAPHICRLFTCMTHSVAFSKATPFFLAHSYLLCPRLRFRHLLRSSLIIHTTAVSNALSVIKDHVITFCFFRQRTHVYIPSCPV